MRVLESEGVLTEGSPILDVGSGDAWFAEQLIAALPPQAQVTCWDPYYTDNDLRRVDPNDKSRPVLTAEQPSGSFSGILMLDVIEHVECDIEFVRAIVEELLDREGWLLLSVPAYQALFTAHDVALGHFRRYTPARCRAVLKAAGLAPRLQGGLFSSLLAIRAGEKLRERLIGPAPVQQGIGAWHRGDPLTRGLTSMLQVDGRLSIEFATRSNVIVPGLSYWAFCRRAPRTLRQ